MKGQIFCLSCRVFDQALYYSKPWVGTELPTLVASRPCLRVLIPSQPIIARAGSSSLFIIEEAKNSLSPDFIALLV